MKPAQCPLKSNARAMVGLWKIDTEQQGYLETSESVAGSASSAKLKLYKKRNIRIEAICSVDSVVHIAWMSVIARIWM